MSAARLYPLLRVVPRSLRRAARLAARRFGLDVRPYSGMLDSSIRLARVCEHQAITLVVDVGANDGAWAAGLRLGGYKGRIVSIEPQSSEFAKLAARATADPLWTALRLAAGRENGHVTLPLSQDSVWTSFLPSVGDNAAANVVGEEKVPLATLDSALVGLVSNEDRVFLKLDVQGYEMEVVGGGTSLFPNVLAAFVEVILVPLYEGQPSRAEIFSALESRGLRFAGVENGHISPETGEDLYIDALFVRA